MSARVAIILVRGAHEADPRACLEGLTRAGPDPSVHEVICALPEVGGWSPPAASVPVRWAGGEGEDPWAAANAAAKAASAEILLFLPADAIPEPDLGGRHAAGHAGDGCAVILGDVVPAPGAHPLASLRRAWDPGMEALGPVDYVGQTFSVPAALFRRAAGFTVGLPWGAEAELVHRLRGFGARLVRIDRPTGRRARTLSARALLRARTAAGKGSVELYRRTPSLLPHLELGGFHTGDAPGVWLRRMLLAIGGPPVPLGVGRLLPLASWRAKWLRFQHEYHFWRGVRDTLDRSHWERLVRPPVILMYHAIGRADERAGCYVVPLPRFRRQMRWLAIRGYRVLGLHEVLECRRQFRLPPPRAVVITFDDGYDDNAQLAVPVLRASGYPATFFLVSGALGDRNRWDPRGELAGRPMLTGEDARAMLEAGMEIGAHTRTHPALPGLDAETARREIAGAREELEAVLGHPLRTFAYPFGLLDERVTAMVGQGGFEAACCSRSGVNDPAVPSLMMRRVEVRGTDSLVRFALATRRGWVRRRRRG